MKTTKTLGIILVALIIGFIVTMIIININPKKHESTQANNKLAESDMLMLLKYAEYHLTESDNLIDNSITDESMIIYATDYMNVIGGYDIIYTDDYVRAKVSDIESVVKYIFDRNINYSNVTFKINGEYLQAPIYPVGTDAEIYKFKSREYNEAQDTYTVYIDCLEVGTSMYSEIIEGSVTEYDEKYVIQTLAIKYKENNGRKILLAYDSIFNMNY